MKLLNLTILSLTLLFAGFSISCNNDTKSIQVNNWKILYEQDKSLDSVLQKNGWESVEIPATFEFPYPQVNDFQFVWLKGEFNIKDDPSRYYGISTGKIMFSDRVYINKQFIGSLPSKKAKWSPVPRNYIIHENILKKGKNIVHIQLGGYSKNKCGISNDVLIQMEEDFDQTEFFSDLLYRHIPIGMVVMFAGFIIPLLIIFLWNRNEKLPLYSLLTLLVIMFFLLIILSSNKYISFEYVLIIAVTTMPLIFISLLLVIQSIYRVYLTNFNRTIILFPIVFMAVMLLSRDTKYNFQIALLLMILFLIIIIPLFAFMIYRLNSINPDKFLRNMIIIIAIMNIFLMMFEGYSGYAGKEYSDIVGFLSPLIFLILLAILFSRQIMKRRIELQYLYNKLKRLEGQDKELSITDTSEEKLKRVIDFIDENFTSDISREGLAAAVGLNPNYMGSLFKTYTGKSINEYINNLRIDDAIRQLDSENSRIIDIAFSVGYESLVTFNRVFKKVTGKTPSEYKNGK